MTAIDRRARPAPLLVGGLATGVVLAVLTGRPESGPLAVLLATALPFLLAALTGVAKTTTA
jgi:hypothetical protein